MKRFIVILVSLFIVSINAFAQNSMIDEYRKFTQQVTQRYTDFRDECNGKYVEFLKQAWEYYKAAPVIPMPKEDEVPPVVIEDDREKPIDDKELPYDEVVPAPVVEPQPQPIEPVTPQPVIVENWFEFPYFNTAMKVRADDSHRFKLASLDGNDVSKVWEQLMSDKYDNMIVDCLKIRDDYQLCDWAYLLMLLHFSGEFLQSENEMILLTAYLYSQSGYKMRLGADENGLTLLFGTKHQIYGLPYFDIDGDYYYPLNGGSEEMRIADFAFPNEKNLSLLIPSEPLLYRSESDERQLKSEGYGTVASCSVNTNLIAFFDSYPTSQLDDNPMTRWAMYANTPLDSSIKQKLYPAHAEAMDGKSYPEAADILLDFVQSAFVYEYDDKVWGGDRALFAEESLFYPYCDCEDRSILYSRLVRDLLGLDVILVYYPGHLATAVKFEEELKGDYIQLGTDKYLVCDPTYIGACIGMTMPDMDNNSAKVILLK